MVFEDSTAGVLAAKAARWRAWRCPRRPSGARSLIAIADLVLDSLEDLDLEVLDQLLAEVG